MKYLNIFRHIAQVAVISLFCALPWLNAHEINSVSGSLFAFDISGFPFADPANALQAMAGGVSIGVFPLRMICLGALMALLVALCLGRIFCGWLCPYGFFSEILFALRGKFFKNRKSASDANSAYWGKTGIVIAGLLAMALFGYPLISLLSFPGDLSLAPLLIWQGAPFFPLASVFILPCAVLALEFIFGRRLWCGYICPQSVLLGAAAWILPKKIPGLRIRWNAKKCVCGKNSPCRDACSLGLDPRKKEGPNRRDCLMCGACLKTCDHYGKALKWKINSDAQ